MLPLTVDDLLPLEEYAGRRKEFFDAQRRYVDRYRRIRIGPKLTLIFENRQTLWFRVQEVIRIARLAEPGEVQRRAESVQSAAARRRPFASRPLDRDCRLRPVAERARPLAQIWPASNCSFTPATVPPHPA